MKMNLTFIVVFVMVLVSQRTQAQSTSPLFTDSTAPPPTNLTAFAVTANTSEIIRFSEYPINTVITNQYQNIGVVFTGGTFITTDGANPTSPVLSGNPRFQGPITCSFVVPGTTTPTIVKSFTFDAGYFDNFGSTRVEWFDPQGNKLGQRINSILGIERLTIEGGNIASWRISVIANEPAGFAIDNLSFERVGPSVLFREKRGDRKDGTWGFLGDEIPGFDHSAFHIDNKVYECHPGYLSGVYVAKDGSEPTVINQYRGVQAQHTRATFEHDSTVAVFTNVVDFEEIPIDLDVAEKMRTNIESVGSYGFHSNGWRWPGSDLTPSVQKGSLGTFTCVGLVEWAAEQSGQSGGQGFVPAWAESMMVPDPKDRTKQIEVPLLSPQVLFWNMRQQQIFANVKQWVQGLFDPVDFIITDPLGRRLGYTQAMGLINEIPNAFYSGNGDVEQLLIPTAIPGKYTIQLFGVGDSAFAALGTKDTTTSFLQVLSEGQTGTQTLFVNPTPGCKGDVNGDGKIDPADITALNQQLNNFTNGLTHPGDMDNSGELNIIDVDLLTALINANICSPAVNCPAPVNLCSVATNNYTIPTLGITDSCNATSISYVISGATVRNGTGNDASGIFNTGTSIVTWTVTGSNGNSATCSTTIKINPLPVASITSSSPDEFCNKFSLTAQSTIGGPTSYNWWRGNANFATTQVIQLDNANADGDYKVFVTDSNGCKSATPAAYNYKKQNIVSNYTIIGLNKIHLDDNNDVLSGSVGVKKNNGTAEFHRLSSVAGTGTFVKAKNIITENPVNIVTKIYAPATVTLPAMQYNTSTVYALPNYTVNQNVTTVLNGNYRELTIKKNANVTLNGTTFGKITVHENARVTFTQGEINIRELLVNKGANNGYTTILFASDANVKVSQHVKLQEKTRVNMDGRKVTFYMGDVPCDEEKFMIKANDTRMIANVYLPDGKLKLVPANSNSCGGYSNSSITSYLTGLFIAEEVDGAGKNIIWNNYTCQNLNTLVQRSGQQPIVEQELLNSETTEDAGKQTGKEMIDAVATSEMNAKISPNPFRSSFNVYIGTHSRDAATIRITDASGRILEVRTNVKAGSTVQVGASFLPGMYYVEVLQGQQRLVNKMIKLQ